MIITNRYAERFHLRIIADDKLQIDLLMPYAIDGMPAPY